MKIIEKIQKKTRDLNGKKAVTIAFLGDSVTQGCFECYKISEDAIETVFDYPSAYSTRLREILNILYPNTQINIINSGISGGNAVGGALRLERDILCYQPDLVVVSFGLNDACGGMENLQKYEDALREIFQRIKDKGCECIFMTQNYMNTALSCHISNDKLFSSLANQFLKLQNEGVLKEYFRVAKTVAKEFGIPVCDMYKVWEKMDYAGVNVTELLANKLNHPIREFHYYMAIKLLETMFFEDNE